MSEENKLSLKRTRQPSSKNVEKRPRLAEEKISSPKTHNVEVLPCPSEKPKVSKRVSL